jgi:hypothetical protein
MAIPAFLLRHLAYAIRLDTPRPGEDLLRSAPPLIAHVAGGPLLLRAS